MATANLLAPVSAEKYERAVVRETLLHLIRQTGAEIVLSPHVNGFNINWTNPDDKEMASYSTSTQEEHVNAVLHRLLVPYLLGTPNRDSRGRKTLPNPFK